MNLNLRKYVHVVAVTKNGTRKNSRFTLTVDAKAFAAEVVRKGGTARIIGGSH